METWALTFRVKIMFYNEEKAILVKGLKMLKRIAEEALVTFTKAGIEYTCLIASTYVVGRLLSIVYEAGHDSGFKKGLAIADNVTETTEED